MEFNTTNRKLTSSTGYLRDKRDGWVCDHGIYLGKEDDKVNYEEITEDDYNIALKEEEKREEECERNLNDLILTLNTEKNR